MVRRTMIIVPLLLSLAACGQARTPESTIRAWADAAKAGDYASAEALMAGDDFARMTWREPHTRYHRAGRLQQYELIEGPTTTGQSTNATLRWTGSMAPLCITVQVGPDGKLSPISDYRRCTGEASR
ncbi:MAG TPA: hypothetical protein VFZ66_19045 [Herpetosiphonaceae bacterium]